eukprot:CAMPEP_0197306900 /NCGR_PEP_ID=MMETSP0891-20130614/4199_1 /TAXON_ID=44058 ORGANISM="Aureoumbra lagunensis, Strain CCMP1510" /NCGR_SAMPLE_ID=MMETSP0891 /ASSEMBLY_ACC=CAM_ASM_000534 /LENGTH=35 /DNA_ID= /DNA_START= /DNA_END= /DNA_ORIENTATION=
MDPATAVSVEWEESIGDSSAVLLLGPSSSSSSSLN